MDLQLNATAVKGLSAVHMNLSRPELYEAIVTRGEAQLAKGGAIAATTGEYTGRSPKDKYIVSTSTTENVIWWDGKEAHRFTREQFDALHRKQLDYLKGKELFVRDCYAGAGEQNQMRVRIATERAWHNLFAHNMFRRVNDADVLKNWEPEFSVLQTPGFSATPDADDTRSEVFVALDLERRLVMIGGTRYAGEIKKSIFTALNYLLPLKGVLGMHCSANTGANGDSAVFFGLSGTGKTTLSADASRELIGDDEHGWSDQGIFNFEGGCYAKVIRLSQEAEPEIHRTTGMFGTILENVPFFRGTRIPNLDDDSLTENTRASYPLESIDNIVESGTGGHPKHVIMLTCDAFGVLPPVAMLSPEQAMYHFISGYTAKVAGTERGVTEPKATFSACFGAPFMPLHPGRYAELLGKKIEEHGTRCWLLNTGWSGGAYGVGSRMPIRYSRALLNAALAGTLNDVEMRVDPTFGVSVPVSCPGVPDEILDPRSVWDDTSAYDERAAKLAQMFHENFKAFEDGVTPAIRKAGPRVGAAV